jgi:hypothetical protein
MPMMAMGMAPMTEATILAVVTLLVGANWCFGGASGELRTAPIVPGMNGNFKTLEELCQCEIFLQCCLAKRA